MRDTRRDAGSFDDQAAAWATRARARSAHLFHWCDDSEATTTAMHYLHESGNGAGAPSIERIVLGTGRNRHDIDGFHHTTDTAREAGQWL
ncbi:hypothetical protein [Xanthomonas sp. 3058]|uniref:hypothetical protein n=1 Tax=Xanthomonas sp. 3058 TaxID=3035314 RepID=UPI00161ACC12|nr:hypothetical protein [Xanthomonas sp. 3058]MBB5864557.1 hypothetical protein [Xanthomonas sp. 3058]